MWLRVLPCPQHDDMDMNRPLDILQKSRLHFPVAESGCQALHSLDKVQVWVRSPKILFVVKHISVGVLVTVLMVNTAPSWLTFGKQQMAYLFTCKVYWLIPSHRLHAIN